MDHIVYIKVNQQRKKNMRRMCIMYPSRKPSTTRIEDILSDRMESYASNSYVSTAPREEDMTKFESIL